jgi:RNA polymerase sigma-70 factor (ECF subfamily)
LDEASTRVLVERSRKGDREAFGELYRAFEGDVARLCLRLLGSPEDAEEATHETFLRARKGLDRYTLGRPFRPWLLGVASHLAIDRLRRRRTERRLFRPEELGPEEIAADGPSPLQREIDEAWRRRLLAAIDALPDRYRAPLVLRYYAELEIGEIAALLEVTRNQVATLLFRARRRLREALGEDEGAPA